MKELAKLSKYLILALAAILLAHGWWQNKQHPRPTGVIAVTLYFLTIALMTFESISTLLAFYGAVIIFAAAGVWFMRSDGRLRAMLLSWINIGIPTLLCALMFSNPRYVQERAHLGEIGQILLATFFLALISIPISILLYLKNERVASLFTIEGLVRKEVGANKA